MGGELNDDSFARLLDHLDADRGRAGERYEDLRRTLVRYFEWRGAPFPDEHADDALDRVARKLGEGVAINNLQGYCYAVARLVYLETLKRPEARRAPAESTDAMAAPDRADDAADKESRLACLDRCLSTLPADGRVLIIQYYAGSGGTRSEARRELAGRLGIRIEALANRAQRLRDKLQHCVNDCLRTKSPT